jgi:hypothetical protein
MDNAIQDFYNDYTKALEEGYAAIFAGAGLSQPSGFVNWKELLREIAKELGLDVDLESDLIALAQYHVNTRAGRSQLNRLLIEEFTKDAEITENHKLVANLPLRTVWTTNYDSLIEESFREVHKRPDVKITQDNLAITFPKRDVTIYKMHGDVSQPQEAVLTKEDYEVYNDKRALFSDLLKGDLISKTFLFLGFSFTDPNIDYILSRIRNLLGQNQRQHYCVMKRLQKPKAGNKAKAQYEYDKTKFDLRIADLRRYSIRALMIDDYAEITAILQELNRRSHRKDIFISGSAHEYGSWGRDRIEELARTIGQDIIRRGYNLTSGFGLGIGSAAIVGSLEALNTENKSDIDERMRLRPFPQRPPHGMTLEQFWTKYRQDMLSNVGCAIFLCGNKLDRNTGQTVIANGVVEEFRITKKFRKYPIPIGATGYAAHEIWKEVTESLDHFYPGGGVRGHFKTLGNPNKTNEEIINAIFAIVNSAIRQ